MVQGPLGLIRYDTQGGLLSGFTSGGGPLSKIMGAGNASPTATLNARLAAVRAARSPADKVKALVGTIGSRFKAPGAGSVPPATPPQASADARSFLANLQVGQPQIVRSNFH